MRRSGEVGAGGDSDRFFLLGHLHEVEVGIVFGALQQQAEPRLGQRRRRPDTGRLDAFEDRLGVVVRNRHAPSGGEK